MRDYRLYQLYTREYGLTFLPKRMDDATYEIATELMLRALHREGPAVTHDLIDEQRGTNYVAPNYPAPDVAA
jgi:hypothetical protein